MIIKKAFPFFAVAILLLIIFLPTYTKIQELRDRNRDLFNKNIALGKENKLLEEQLRRIENDPVYQEKILREKMGVVRKDEVPVRIVGGKE
ncbi:MAG: septum formation initiator family protein [Candidatus Omnitrophota bacterium]|nr:septum formation initiator family protein [Candidatus Omnitrophota bacterium]MBU1929511.1 septum formation initiator family protein [Candidatus Omnitrophota bacterium]MBU2035308.1 septum formation initiator family protein [Candidatus Omnitrophota bacterium]MBU2258460.1 septum formation initiator family protein [Candidatus Omnitrophota bacterium]